MKNRKIVSLILAGILAFSLAACGTTAAEQPAEPEKTDAAAAEPAAAEPVYQSEDGEFVINKGDWVIGVSNSYYGNQWRKTMVDSFERLAAQLKEEGVIADFEVQNGDNTVNAQIAQINTFILEGVDAILIDPCSTTALNSVIQEALNAGIVVVCFDCGVENDSVAQVDYNFADFGYQRVAKLVELKGTDELNVIRVQGIEGTGAEAGYNEGNLKAFAEYPGINVLASFYGDSSATTTQEELMKLIPSLNEHVDAVITTCGGDAYGAAMAFANYYDEEDMPLILGDNGAEFIEWWGNFSEKYPDYVSWSNGTAPSVVQTALWCALYALNGGELPAHMYAPFAGLTQDELPEWRGVLEPGTVYAPDYDAVWTYENIIKPYK